VHAPMGMPPGGGTPSRTRKHVEQGRPAAPPLPHASARACGSLASTVPFHRHPRPCSSLSSCSCHVPGFLSVMPDVAAQARRAGQRWPWLAVCLRVPFVNTDWRLVCRVIVSLSRSRSLLVVRGRWVRVRLGLGLCRMVLRCRSVRLGICRLLRRGSASRRACEVGEAEAVHGCGVGA